MYVFKLSGLKGVQVKGPTLITTMKCSFVNCYFLTFFAKTVQTLMIPSEDLLIKMHEHGMFNRINFISKEESTRNALRYVIKVPNEQFG